MSKIHQLSETLINQIKAGEVVERPASALKELLDNAIDSGATSIKASIEKGGLTLISVEDDGEGIEPEDLPLAFARHATSKIKTFEDLSIATTMGFRGEALASLAAIAKCKISSKRADQEAFEIEAENGEVGQTSPTQRRQGTTVQARDLFFYVPARRKFLKSEPTEAGHCRDSFVRAALSRPDIAMSFQKDGKIVYRLPVQSAIDRAKVLLGNSFSGSIALVDASFPPFSIKGFAVPIGALPSGKETQLLFVNKRYARDKLLSHAVKEALIQSRGLGREREVAFVLHLSLPTELVDANAHPAKTEVRFKDPRAVHQFVYKSLLDALATLPAPAALPSDERSGRPLSTMNRPEMEIDLFAESTTQHSSAPGRMPIQNDAERFIGILRGGACAWDAGDCLWLAPASSLAAISKAGPMSDKALNGELAGAEQIIPASATLPPEVKNLLARRSNQLQALGIDLEWTSEDSAMITFAPEGFDNCDWNKSLLAIFSCLSTSRSDALSLCLALCSGLPLDPLSENELWNAASYWMDMRRLARELPGSWSISIE